MNLASQSLNHPTAVITLASAPQETTVSAQLTSVAPVNKFSIFESVLVRSSPPKARSAAIAAGNSRWAVTSFRNVAIEQPSYACNRFSRFSRSTSSMARKISARIVVPSAAARRFNAACISSGMSRVTRIRSAYHFPCFPTRIPHRLIHNPLRHVPLPSSPESPPPPRRGPLSSRHPAPGKSPRRCIFRCTHRVSPISKRLPRTNLKIFVRVQLSPSTGVS